MKNKVWIARDKDGKLYMYFRNKPVINIKGQVYQCSSKYEYTVELEESGFKDITWESGPKELNIIALEDSSKYCPKCNGRFDIISCLEHKCGIDIDYKCSKCGHEEDEFISTDMKNSMVKK